MPEENENKENFSNTTNNSSTQGDNFSNPEIDLSHPSFSQPESMPAPEIQSYQPPVSEPSTVNQVDSVREAPNTYFQPETQANGGQLPSLHEMQYGANAEEGMDKRLILIVGIASLVFVLLIGGLIYFLSSRGSSETEEIPELLEEAQGESPEKDDSQSSQGTAANPDQPTSSGQQSVAPTAPTSTTPTPSVPTTPTTGGNSSSGSDITTPSSAEEEGGNG